VCPKPSSIDSKATSFENSVEQQNTKEGALLMGTVVSINREKAVISVGLNINQ
jgi:small subunit ribosomal protein S1